MNEPKPLWFTRHALDALAERELQADWVEATIRAPDWRETDPHDSAVTRCFRVIPERGGRIMRVAMVETEAEIRILSAFLDRRAKRPA